MAADYLRTKSGFILVSHDRWFLDQTVDHIISLNKTGAEVVAGDYSTYRENKRLRDEFEIEQNARLSGEIKRLKAENARLREDVAILRAATTFFVGELDPRNR